MTMVWGGMRCFLDEMVRGCGVWAVYLGMPVTGG